MTIGRNEGHRQLAPVPLTRMLTLLCGRHTGPAPPFVAYTTPTPLSSLPIVTTQGSKETFLTLHNPANSITKKTEEKQKKMARTFRKPGGTGVPIFSLNGERLGGQPHNMSAPGRHIFLVH